MAGLGGFGKLADAAIESVTRSIVTGMLPTDTRTHIYYASPGHPFCPDEQSFTDAILEKLLGRNTVLGVRGSWSGDRVRQSSALIRR